MGQSVAIIVIRFIIMIIIIIPMGKVYCEVLDCEGQNTANS